MKAVSANYSFLIKLRQMKYIKVVLGLRDGRLESNWVLKTVQMVQIVLYAFSGPLPAQISVRNCKNK